MASKRSKSAPGPASVASLPDEIVEAILLRMPASCTFRFRAVCRSWAALLSSPGFAEAYAAEADARRRVASKYLFFAPSPASPAGATAVYSCSQGCELFTIDGLRPGFLLVTPKLCNGLVLLTDTRSFSYWVCNPSTGEFRRLPQQRRHGRGGLSSAGLAYDDQAKEHKVVHLFCSQDRDTGCEVYTLCTPSRQWRPAARGVPRCLRGAVFCALFFEAAATKVPPVFANGCLHWQIYRNMQMSRELFRDAVSYPPDHLVSVLYFSIADETFGLVAGPATVGPRCDIEDASPAVPLHLVELQGSLCMVRDLRHLPHEESLMEIWALRDYRTSVWSLVHRIATTPQVAGGMRSPRFLTVLGCLRGDAGRGEETILIATSQHKVHAYQPATGDVQTVLAVPENVLGFQDETVAGIRLGLYEDNLARTGRESRRQTEVASALTQILLRLPIESVARCALVCKQWHTLIESEGFVTLQLLASKQRRKVMMITNGRARKNFFGFMPVEAWLGAPTARMDSLLVDGKIMCSKPCHGLNLITTGSDDYLCNPCTGSIQCLGIRGKLRESPHDKDRQPTRRRNHAFAVGSGRNVGLGFDRLTREHVAVEISHVGGALVCMVKTSCAEYWSRVGEPPMPVIDMPPAHVDGTLYWMSEPEAEARDRFVVAFDIPTKAFTVLPCQPCNGTGDGDPFLVELDGALALVLANDEENVLRIWMMRERGTWVNSYNISVDKHPDFSLRRHMVVPLEVAGGKDSSRILLNTGRALGYYDTRTGAIEVMYSLDQLQLPRRSLAFPIVCEESLCRVQDDEQPDHFTPPIWDEGRQRDGGADVSTSYIFRPCERSGCQGPVSAYASCCRRVLCEECCVQCKEHRGSLPTEMASGSPSSVQRIAEEFELPFEHPSVPGPEYCYYYSMRDEEDDVRSHVFVAVKDVVRKRQPRRLVECGYRMDGEVVRETWVERYLAYTWQNF